MVIKIMLIMLVLIVVGVPLYLLLGKVVHAVDYLFSKLIMRQAEYYYDPNGVQKILWPATLFFVIVVAVVTLLVMILQVIFEYWLRSLKWCWEDGATNTDGVNGAGTYIQTHRLH